MMGADHLRKVAGYDFHDLRRKYDVRTMRGDLDPQWRLLPVISVSSAVLDGSYFLVRSCNFLLVVKLGVVPKYGFCCAKCLKFFFSVNIGLNRNIKSTLGGD